MRYKLIWAGSTEVGVAGTNYQIEECKSGQFRSRRDAMKAIEIILNYCKLTEMNSGYSGRKSRKSDLEKSSFQAVEGGDNTSRNREWQNESARGAVKRGRHL